MAVRNKRDGTLSVIDGTPSTPIKSEIQFAEGDFTYNDPEQNEPIVIKNRKGAMDHVKAADEFAGWGNSSFSAKYVSNAIKEKMCNPAVSSAVAADGIPTKYKTVNVEYAIVDEDGTTVVETHKLYNVWFDKAKVKFAEGEESSTLSCEGRIFGKSDGAGGRIFSEVVTP